MFHGIILHWRNNMVVNVVVVHPIVKIVPQHLYPLCIRFFMIRLVCIFLMLRAAAGRQPFLSCWCLFFFLLVSSSFHWFLVYDQVLHPGNVWGKVKIMKESINMKESLSIHEPPSLVCVGLLSFSFALFLFCFALNFSNTTFSRQTSIG